MQDVVKVESTVAVPQRSIKGKGQFDYPLRLSQYVHQHTAKWILETTAGGCRYMLLKGLFTDHAFQKRGMGNAMVQHGNRIADSECVPILLQASERGWPIYARQAFKTVQHLDIDLASWTSEGWNDDAGCRTYRFRYILRRPKMSEQTDISR